MTTKLQHIGQKTADRTFTISEAKASTLARQRIGSQAMVAAIFDVLTESQQLRVLQQFGWTIVPGTAETVVHG